MAAEVSVVSDIAGRYATALFELAQDQGQLDACEADMKALSAMIDDSPELLRLLRSPIFTHDEQAKAMDAVMERAGSGALLRKFVGLAIANRRAFALRDMARGFANLLAEHRGEVMAHVTSATPLEESQISAISAQLKSAMKTDVSVETAVDPSILGGLVVRVGSRMVDSSVRTKLQNLSFAMKGVE